MNVIMEKAIGIKQTGVGKTQHTRESPYHLFTTDATERQNCAIIILNITGIKEHY
jgi:hypothetical protein